VRASTRATTALLEPVGEVAPPHEALGSLSSGGAEPRIAKDGYGTRLRRCVRSGLVVASAAERIDLGTHERLDEGLDERAHEIRVSLSHVRWHQGDEDRRRRWWPPW